MNCVTYLQRYYTIIQIVQVKRNVRGLMSI